jgi:hypothetical protein
LRNISLRNLAKKLRNHPFSQGNKATDVKEGELKAKGSRIRVIAKLIQETLSRKTSITADHLGF